MNTVDILKYGDRFLQRILDGVPQPEWETGGVCGWWSVKNIMAHLTSYEQFLGEILQSFLGGGESPALNRFFEAGPEKFNDIQVEMRKEKSPQEVLAEYNDAYARVAALAPRFRRKSDAKTARSLGTAWNIRLTILSSTRFTDTNANTARR